MKLKEKQTISAMSVDEIRKQVREAQGAFANFKVNRMMTQTKNVREGRRLRKRIAVLATMVRAKEMNHV